MAPIRRRVDQFSNRHPNGVVLIIMALFVTFAGFMVYSVYKLQTYAEDNRNLIRKVDEFGRRNDVKLCESGNRSRNDIARSYAFSRDRAVSFYKTNPDPRVHIKQIEDFYNDLIRDIKSHNLKCDETPVK